MKKPITQLSDQETRWILEKRLTRLTDQKKCLIYPMGAERYLSLVLFKNKKRPFNIKNEIRDKSILVIPGYANNGFMFAEAGAKSVMVCDKDPVTIAWLKAFKKFYNFRENNKSLAYPSVGELLHALTAWYPPLLRLPVNRLKLFLQWVLDPRALRSEYFSYLLKLTQLALQSTSNSEYEFEHVIHFTVGEIDDLIQVSNQPIFDLAYVPYLLGVSNGIEKEVEIVHFFEQLGQIIPNGSILVTPTRNTKEFYVVGQRYFSTIPHANLTLIPHLGTFKTYHDSHWFKTQGLAVFQN